MALFQVIFFIVVSILLSFQPSTSAGICSVFYVGIDGFTSLFVLAINLIVVAILVSISHAKNQTKAILTLTFTGEFIVYLYQGIWINDPNYCTPRRLLKGLNLSDTPFKLEYPESYVFLNCSNGAISKQLPEVRYISCLSGETFSVVAILENQLDM
ncbi:hypothetical protein GOBAR_DD19417 [Gossypium barbadense]|nr:hypothetical protein GOBAR_DD19417 [Gossypium barbadense]